MLLFFSHITYPDAKKDDNQNNADKKPIPDTEAEHCHPFPIDL
jgi:hypothetical protein